jgi:hypothetical protein
MRFAVRAVFFSPFARRARKLRPSADTARRFIVTIAQEAITENRAARQIFSPPLRPMDRK